MRTGLWILLPCSIAMAALFACSAQQAAPGQLNGAGDDDDDTGGKTTTKAANTCLGKAGLAYDNAACNTCMSADGCCQKTIACFSKNPECAALQTCMAACGGGTAATPGTSTTDGGGGGGGGGTTNNAAKASFTTNVYPSIVTTCGSCHQSGGTGSPTFLLGAADATYTYFKTAGWTTNQSPFYTHGAHSGPALTADQKTKIDAWIALEASTPTTGSGSGTGTGGGGGGGGGGNGSGGGNGDGSGGGNGTGKIVECQTACKTQHAAAVTAWTDFNVCVTQTCGSTCL